MRSLKKIALSETEAKICDLLLSVADELRARPSAVNVTLRIAGGWVRDKLLGLDSSDLDVALDNILGLDFAKEVNAYMERNGLSTHHISKIESNPERSKHLETATTKVFDQPVDFVNLRTEIYDDGSRIPEMAFGTAEDDAMRRDITINAMFYNLHTKEVEDFTGKGLSDLREGVIRTPLSPLKTFVDDPLRILRVVRFSSRYGFAIDPDIFKACTDPKLKDAFMTKISRERVGTELDKMLKGPNPLSSLEVIHKFGFFDAIFATPSEADLNKASDDVSHQEYAILISRYLYFLLENCSYAVGFTSTPLDADDRRILYYSACLYVFKDSLYKEKKHDYPLPRYVILKSLKLSSNDSDNVCGLILSVHAVISACCNPIKDRQQLGLVLRDICSAQRYTSARPLGGKWILALWLSAAVDLANVHVGAGRNLSLQEIEQRVAKFMQFKDEIKHQNLENIHDMRPLLNGQEVAKILNIKPGPDAIVVERWLKSVDELDIKHVPIPNPEDDEVLVKVKAIGLNFFDILMVQGKYQSKPPFPFIPGAEVAGDIIAVGKNVHDFKVGQRVFGTGPNTITGFAEFVKMKAVPGLIFPLPPKLSYEEGAALFMTYPTSYLGLVFRGELKKGEICLVHAGAGGVGTAGIPYHLIANSLFKAIQIAKSIGAVVIATAGSDEKCEIAKAAGADYTINYSAKDWVAIVNAISSKIRGGKGKGVDVIYDPVGTFIKDTGCIAWNGRILVVGFAGTGKAIEAVPSNRLLLKGASLVGVFWGGTTINDRKLAVDTWQGVFSLLSEEENGKPKYLPVVYPTKYVGLSSIPRALKDLESRKTWGKVVCTLESNDSKL
ncbi:CCA tRNA nucleotidyltransferase, mitochondrial [Phlyctochytrium planicorne]|nr:CCA tRNA nucleotidyltransferase, mitochondrial [Phlyctochytrium planicorne]